MSKVTNIDDLIAELERQKTELKGDYSNFAYGRYGGLDYAIDLAKQIANVEIVPVVHGYWIDMGDFESCSVCKSTQLKKFESMYGTAERVWTKTSHCPDCGAKMDLKSLEMNEFTEMDSGN